jgi:hypothetical protein
MADDKLTLIEVSEDCAKAVKEAVTRNDYNKIPNNNDLANMVDSAVTNGVIQAIMEVHPACPGVNFTPPSGPFAVVSKRNDAITPR